MQQCSTPSRSVQRPRSHRYTTTPRINEIHYDNEGTDVGEFVEVYKAEEAQVVEQHIRLTVFV